jgi:general secretion pathway protein C
MTLIKPYFIFFNCLLLVCAAYLGVKSAYNLAGTRLKTVKTVMQAGKTATVLPETLRKPLARYESVARRNLFDVKTNTAANIEPVDLDAMEPTELKLKLWGTVLGTPQDKSFAVIEDSKYRIQSLYHQGDTVQDATIKMILRGKVVLLVNGRDEILEMEKVGKGSPDGQRVELIAPAENVVEPRSSAPFNQKVSLDRSEISKAMVNLTDLMDQVKIMPNFNNGEPEGFRLSGIKTDSLVRKMGLRNGDVITGVNGTPIRTMEDAMGFYQQLGGADQVTLQVKRRGRERNIEYNIK